MVVESTPSRSVYVLAPDREPQVMHWSPRLVKAKDSTALPPPVGKLSYSPSSGSHAREPANEAGSGLSGPKSSLR